MSLWAKTQLLPPDIFKQVQSVYGEHFPIEVRHFLAQSIEEKPWNTVDSENPHHESFASGMVTALIQELETKASQLSGHDAFLMKFKLLEIASYFRATYTPNPLNMVRIIKHCLNVELKLVQAAENVSGEEVLDESQPPMKGLEVGTDMGVPLDRHHEIISKLDNLKRRTQETEEFLKMMQQEQEQLILQYQESKKLEDHLTSLTQQHLPQQVELIAKVREQKDFLEKGLAQRCVKLYEMRMNLERKHDETFQLLSTIQSQVLDEELIRWKRDQQLQGNGATFVNNLDQIQEWCETLAEIIWKNRQQIKHVEMLRIQLNPQTSVDNLQQLNTKITSLLSSLVTSTFIIEKQPPQVMKTNTRFTATVRLLVGGKLNVHMNPPQVKVTIISEAQANALLKNEMSKGDVSGEILNNMGTMEYHQATRQLSVSFRNMQLRKIKRAEKKGTESVMDEKFSLLFQSQFKVGGGELVFQVWTLSLPVVVIVHGNQEPHAWATVSWDNAFAEPGRVPFAVPEKVPWAQMAEVLNCKFKHATGRGLPEDSLRFLAGKVFRNPNLQDYSNLMLSWSQFCKEPLPERNFTFWEWFFAIMKLTREHLRAPWNDGHILGFVTRPQAEEMLLSRPKGTFLLRFSDSELGGVTIAWNQEDPSEQKVFMLQPFTNKDFSIRSLADRINDLKYLLYLYPEVGKDQAFGKYYTPMNDNVPPTGNGYVKPVLVVHVPCLPDGSCMESYPSTPQPVMSPCPEGSASAIKPDPGYSCSTVSDPGVNEYNDYYDEMDELLSVLDSTADEMDYTFLSEMLNHNMPKLSVN